MVSFKVETFPKMRVIGKGVILLETEIDHQIEDLWASMEADGSFDVLAQLPGRLGLADVQPPASDWVGWMGDFHPPDMHFTYLAGGLFEPDVAAPEGFLYRDIEAGD